ncbi:protein of unknown function [Pseudomonas sp. LAMO17WK12:I10]|uniref:DUF4055 domain-containing protein n=1 Tax=unclassified Pseudomonas TaxID=196821 RepID=UPI000BDD1E17|nr:MULTISPECIES: DUF4055 domain-containing protein [unclassified Pseudomonas]PXX59511.1 uncharacterized protein DUF4055 [Pseudomonas sp. LAMO17WK12:I9]SNY46661.1 protein of unknown function [Pseudomonas sp. LAMO17WK12:I10]
MSDDPNKTLPAVDAMRQDWEIVDALMGGTKAMRDAGEKFLPKWPKEEDDAYKARLQASTLLPAYSETVQNMSGRVFAEPISLGDDVPESIQEFAQDIDRQGNNLQVWAQSVFVTGLSHGLCHVLAEYPKVEGLKTKADDKAAGVRPYAVTVKPHQVLGWRAAAKAGDQVLTQFRYLECIEEDEGLFGVKVTPQIRVLEPGRWATYRKADDGKGGKSWQLYDEGVTTLDVIPLATFYTKRTGFMTATPPLLELAHLNKKHWQSQSDQDNILHVARVPMLAIIGIEDDAFELKVGTSSATKLPKEGDMKWVEHTGSAIEAGRTSLQDLVDDMRMAGAKLLLKDKQSTKTATQAEDEAAQEMSPLQTMAESFEDCLDQVLQYFAMWTKQPEGGHVQVNGNFDIDFAPETTLPLLLNMAAQGRLSDETLFSEFQRRGVVSDDLDWELEKQKIADQGPVLGAL